MTNQTPLRFAVIGHPVAHSRSPDIHTAFAAQFGIDLVYERIDSLPEAFEARVQAFFADGGAGLNITVPFKERAWQMAKDHLSARAQDAGAVNTLWQANHTIHGCNTDGLGLVNDLKRLGMRLANANILLIGAGGAARGVIGPLLACQCQHIRIINRTAVRAHELVTDWVSAHPRDAALLSAGGLDELSQPPAFDLVINATASSLKGDALALPAQLFGPSVHAYDMMYASDLTPFLCQAQRGGSTHLSDGLGMLVGQAAQSFEIWHGQMPDTEPVIAKVRAQLQSSVR